MIDEYLTEEEVWECINDNIALICKHKYADTWRYYKHRDEFKTLEYFKYNRRYLLFKKYPLDLYNKAKEEKLVRANRDVRYCKNIKNLKYYYFEDYELNNVLQEYVQKGYKI